MAIIKKYVSTSAHRPAAQSGAYERSGGQGQMVRMVRTRVVGVCASGGIDRNGSGRPKLREVIHPG